MGDPTNTTFRTNSFFIADCPVELPNPQRTFTKPLGRPEISRYLTNATVVTGVNSLGLITTPFPHAIAGAICQPAVKIGAFQGVI